MVVEVGRGGTVYVPDTGMAGAGSPRMGILTGRQTAAGRVKPQPARRAVLLGDGSGASYHPLQAVQEMILGALKDDFDAAATEDYSVLEGPASGTGLIAAYTDRWEDPVTPEQAKGIIDFVGQGGGLVLIHSGISLAADPRLEEMIGARFIGHPPYQTLSFEPVVGKGGAHPIVQNIEPFDSPDEPYRYSFSRSKDREVILEYWLDGCCYPAAWVQRYGEGRIAVLMPGHDRASFESGQVQRLIRSASLWAAGRI
ncbi:ThuA domain-containing protein [Paenibacillus sp. D51F]